MRINKWIGTDVAIIPGLSQEARPRDSWPYAQDWIVGTIAWDTACREYYVRGHLIDGSPFSWSLYNRPLSWRYDLSAARFEVGRHETASESLQRENAKRRILTTT